MLMYVFFCTAQGRAQAMGEEPCKIPLRDWEAAYRLFELKDVLPVRDFLDYMFFLDGEFCSYYRRRSKTK